MKVRRIYFKLKSGLYGQELPLAPAAQNCATEGFFTADAVKQIKAAFEEELEQRRLEGIKHMEQIALMSRNLMALEEEKERRNATDMVTAMQNLTVGGGASPAATTGPRAGIIGESGKFQVVVFFQITITTFQVCYIFSILYTIID